MSKAQKVLDIIEEITASDVQDFSDFCKNATDSQLVAIYKKEKDAGRGEFADVARAEMDARGIEETIETSNVSEVISHEGGKWLVKSHKGKVLGTHDTKEKALAQLAAVEISKAKN